MRTLLSWAAAAAILAVPATVWGQQSDSKADSQGQAQASDSSAANSSTTQPPASQQDSLADAARRAREAKKDQAKPARVFDNDNLPGGVISTVGKSPAPKEGDAAATDDAAAAKASPDAEKGWRDKFAQL